MARAATKTATGTAELARSLVPSRLARPFASSSRPACSSHGLEYSFSQLAECEASDVRSDSDEVGARGEFASGFRCDRPQAATPAVPDNCPADLTANGVSDANSSARVVRRREVYSDNAVTGPARRSAEGPEVVPTLDSGRAATQAESFTRPRRTMNTPRGACPSANKTAPVG